MADVLSLDIEADGSDATRTLRQGAREVRDYQEELERLRIEAERTTRTTEDLRRSTDRAVGGGGCVEAETGYWLTPEISFVGAFAPVTRLPPNARGARDSSS